MTVVGSHCLKLETTWDKTKMLSAKSQEYRRLTKFVTFCLARDMLLWIRWDFVKCSVLSIPGTNFHAKIISQILPLISIPELVAETQSSIESQITDGNIYHFAATTDM